MFWQTAIGRVVTSINGKLCLHFLSLVVRLPGASLYLLTPISNPLMTMKKNFSGKKVKNEIDEFLTINTLPPHYEDLFFLWQNRDIQSDEEIELFQFLIDTELAWEIDANFEKRAEYMIAEGLCYYVPCDKV